MVVTGRAQQQDGQLGAYRVGQRRPGGDSIAYVLFEPGRYEVTAQGRKARILGAAALLGGGDGGCQAAPGWGTCRHGCPFDIPAAMIPGSEETFPAGRLQVRTGYRTVRYGVRSMGRLTRQWQVTRICSGAPSSHSSAHTSRAARDMSAGRQTTASP
jgi:hypothetical protein